MGSEPIGTRDAMRARSRKGAGELIEGSEWQAWQESNCMQERGTWWRGRSRARG
jgi:hypothetical protein